MPTSEVVQEQSEPLNYKTWILKVSIHCEGCRRKVKKILTNIQGVYKADIEAKQQKVIVTGNIDADTLINKLIKSGKHAELWPENPNHQKEKKSARKIINKEKQIQQNAPRPNKESGHGSTTVKGDKGIKPPAEVKTGAGASPSKTGGDPKVVEAPVKVSGGHEVKDSNSEGKVPQTGSVREIPIKVYGGQGVKESKSEGKLPETSSSGNQSSAAPVEKKNEGGESDNVAEKSDAIGGGGGNGSGHGGKKKKNKGQTGNKTDGDPRSVAPPASTGSLHHNGGPPPASVPANQSFPRHQGPPHYYTPPPPPTYGVRYNMAHPSSSYTTSYCASPPPNSYAYSYSGSGSGSSMEGPYAFSSPGSSMEPQPTDFDSYPGQPLDSFEMFSDENPNGCSIS